jgi:chromosomal replication initiation ATPase DnaA
MTHYNSPKNKKSRHNPYLAFLQCLDEYQQQPKLTLHQYTSLFNKTQQYYDQYYYPYYSSLIPYYQNTPTLQTVVGEEEDNVVDDIYLRWQKEHEVEPTVNSNTGVVKLRVNCKKEKVDISTSIHSFGDILDILETHPYDSSKEYNIDLKALHKIKNEIHTLNQMIGLESVKKSILRQLMYFMQGFTDDPIDSDYKHTIFTGPPGTGKTEMAKLLGTMYSKIGVLKNNVFKKVTRTDLVAGYLGQTAIKTQKVLDECSGGVLFIDEAYSLQSDDSYAKECVDTLCEALSDRKNTLMVIIAGYTNELDNTFFRINSGLKSRFIWRFDIEPYKVHELFQIFQHLSSVRKWTLEDAINVNWFETKHKHFLDNGRSMEQLFSYSKIAHAQRIYGKDPILRKTLNLDDLEMGYKLYEEYGHTKKDNNIYLGLYT